jgi:hypothetical protein
MTGDPTGIADFASSGAADMVDRMSTVRFAASARHARVVESGERRRGARRISATPAAA